ncbi:MAG TPA: efflux RND transporter periplasmic adaptor subunit, partial [Pseudomonas sp.]
QVLRYDAEAGMLQAVTVDTGLTNWRWTEVRVGLAEGERILPSLEQEGLGDGVAVTPVESPP